mmetsp:Transcript_543/g.1221  ORF Transcript_543/g.1221 Transcript_543/m.1221 type:complete len:120 (+) Transcript_543:282-641(+)
MATVRAPIAHVRVLGFGVTLRHFVERGDARCACVTAQHLVGAECSLQLRLALLLLLRRTARCEVAHHHATPRPVPRRLVLLFLLFLCSTLQPFRLNGLKPLNGLNHFEPLADQQYPSEI